MRIERIVVEAFGRLRDFDTGAAPLGELVVVHGPNEAGKSTLFGFLTTALYGFHPASRERNPLVPWGSDEAAGHIQLVDADGGCVRVERRLRSSPSARLTTPDDARELRNQPVPWAVHVPRAVFGQVFAVTLADLAGLDAATWSRIQDRIVGAMGSDDLGSARAVAEALEQEASEIWRPNRRGKQRLRALQEEMRLLRGRRSEALARDGEVRRHVETAENVRVQLTETRDERQRYRVAVERVQSLLPARRQLARIDGLRSEGGSREALEGLPDDPPGELARLGQAAQKAARRAEELERELEEPRAAIARFDEDARGLLAAADDVERFLSLAAEVAPERRRAADARNDLDEIEANLEAEGRQLLDGGWRPEHGPTVDAISVDLVADRIARLVEASTPDSAVTIGPPPAPRRWLPAAIAALVAGVGVAAWALSAGSPVALVLGAMTAAGGAAAMALALATGRTGPPTRSDRRDLAARARRSPDALLAGLPVRADLLDPPGDPLVRGLARLTELRDAERGPRLALEAARRRLEEADAAAAGLIARLGGTGAAGAEALAPALARDLRDAERAEESAARADRERLRLERELAAARREADDVGDRLAALERALGALAEGDPRRGASVAASRLEAHRTADRLQAELLRAHPDLTELRERIEASERRGDPWTVDDRELARQRARIEELDARIEELRAHEQGLEHDIAHLRELETVDAVDGSLAAFQEKESRLVRERDRKWMLAQLVREADRRFREEHQPDLVRRASAHLAHLTGGRYDRLVIEEDDPEAPFKIVGPGLPAPVALGPPISTGTLEQAYLSLRLAIVDHLDAEPARLPLFLDEAFVNWDRARRDRGLDAVAELAGPRQIFLFTCHTEVAVHLRSRGARVIRLDGGS